ncbi:DUF317 domain-containing protein [Kitasatospora sp. NPDC058190]|uniref:DUF317 domain-containing protein n=1 Tax=Kitasatospora sp. NPDC058190 TaxID=3346371 RepID=UPI0036D8DA2F
MPDYPWLERPREYRVSPRFLAGPTHTGDPGLQPLIDAGWNFSRDDLDNVFVTTPDHTVRCGFLPEGEHGELWSISAHTHAFAPPQWLITFDLQAPPEIVGEFTTALAAVHANDPDTVLGGSARIGLDTTNDLLRSGWRIDPGPSDTAFQTPDRLVTLHRRRGHLRHEAEMAGDTERWLFEVGPPEHRWYATASSNVPDQLLGALATAVANPAPVERYLRPSALNRLPRQAIAVPVAPTPLEISRIQAATARSLAASRRPASALAYTTATGPPAPRQSALAGRSH